MTLNMGVALHFSLQLAYHKSQRSDFGVVCKSNNGTWRFHYYISLTEFFDEKEGTAILERVAFLLRLSIYTFSAYWRVINYMFLIHTAI